MQQSEHVLIPLLGRGLQKYNLNDSESIDPTNTVKVFEEEIWTHIKKYFNKDSKVLDVGCGNGRFSSFLANHVEKVDAIDAFRKINNIHNLENVSYYNKQLQDFNGDQYDVVFLFGVFYLQESWCTYEAFKTLVSKLSDKGVLIIIDDKKRDRDYAKSRHMSAGYYNLKELADLNNVKIFDEFIQKNRVHKVSIIK